MYLYASEVKNGSCPDSARRFHAGKTFVPAVGSLMASILR
jgi:hypothetical protein